jgi:tetratricopeptide (TPR) repeat protein
MKLKSAVIIISLFLVPLFGKENQSNSERRLKAIQTSIKEETNKDYAQALKTMLKIYDNNKTDYLVNLRIGWMYYLNKKNGESLNFYKEAAKLSNNSVESMLGLTYPFSAMEDWEEVKSIYKRIIDIDNLNYTANLRLGEILISSKDFEGSKVLLEKLYKIYPSDYQVNLELGWVYYFQKDLKKANYLFTNALALNPGNDSAGKGIGLTK